MAISFHWMIEMSKWIPAEVGTLNEANGLVQDSFPSVSRGRLCDGECLGRIH